MSPDAAAVVFGAVLVDACYGEVPNRVHPVVGMGKLARRVLAVRANGKFGELALGLGLVLVVAGTSGVAAWGLDVGSRALTALVVGENVVARVAVVSAQAVLLSTLFAGRALAAAGQRMRAALEVSLEEGRQALSHLCSRDPAALSESELCGATVESLAENASDSFVAPLFWYAVACTCGAPGLVGAAVYRAVNTLDAMVGYRGKYEYVGKCAARLDDVLNWVPARVTAVLLLGSAAVCRYDVGRAWQTLRRDRNHTESPNAGWPMAVAAGALGVELTKRNAYVLGRGLNAPTVASVRSCERLICVAFAACTLLVCGYMYAYAHWGYVLTYIPATSGAALWRWA